MPQHSPTPTPLRTINWFVPAIEGRLDEVYAAEKKRAQRAVTAGIRQAATYTRNALRRQVRAARLGTGLEKAWQMEVYPKRGASLDAAAVVYSKSKRLHSAFGADTLIRAKKADALIVPTKLAVRLGLTQNMRLSKGNRPRKWFDADYAAFEYGPLWTIPGKTGGKILMGMVDQLPKALGWIVYEVRLKKRLDLKGPPERFGKMVPSYILANFRRLETIQPSGVTVEMEAA